MEIVDIISTSPDNSKITLHISDHLDWDDSVSHLRLLQEKINRYLAFIESGELYKKYPTAKGSQIVIEVVGLEEPSPEAVIFFAQAKKIIERAGVEFAFRRFTPGTIQ